MEKATLKAKIFYQFDAYLMNLIQEVSNRPTAEILNFFNELGKQVCDIGIENLSGKGMRKHLINYFPNTSIPFSMLAKGHIYRRYQSHGEDNEMTIYVSVGFPDFKMSVKTEQLDDIAVQLMEQALLGGDAVAMPAFPRPEIKTPKMYKKLMEAFSKGKINE